MKLGQLFSILYLVPISLAVSRSKLSERGVYQGVSTVYKRSLTLSDDEHSIEEVDQEDNEIPSFFETDKPQSLTGWLQSPKNRTSFTTEATLENNLNKDGFCEHTLNYGIRCGKRMDQCKGDANCPGVTKCCLVSDCGLMCVKPKAKLKHPIIQKKKQNKEDIKQEVVTTAEGLKLEDITKLPEVENATKSSSTEEKEPPPVTDATEASEYNGTTQLSVPEVITEISDASDPTSNTLEREGVSSTILPDEEYATILPEEEEKEEAEELSAESTVSDLLVQ